MTPPPSGFWGWEYAANFLSDRYLPPSFLLSLLSASLGDWVQRPSALWTRRPPVPPQLNLCNAVIWPNKASIQAPSNCIMSAIIVCPSPPYCVAVETDEHLTAVGWGCHDNAAHPHPCVSREHPSCYLFIYLFVVVVDLVSVISLVLWEQEDGAFLTPGPPPTSSDKGFFIFFSWSRKSFKPDRERRGRSVKAQPSTYRQPGHGPDSNILLISTNLAVVFV